jgi:CRP/FNR family transcriptional regulator
MTHNIHDIVRQRFPMLNEKSLLEELEEQGVYKSVSEGENLMEIGNYIKSMPLLIKGTIKVVREDNEGNEILLYYLNGGETCAMTLTCCMSNAKSEIRATVIDDAEFIMVPVNCMQEWMRKYTSWMNFVMTSYQSRFDEMLRTIDSIAFMKMDERLWKYLVNRSNELGNTQIQITHLEIAHDLNTSREVVSRLLKQLEKIGRISVGRNKINILTLK